MKWKLAIALMLLILASFLFGIWFYSDPQVRKERIDEYKEKILKKERRFWSQ